MSGCLVIVESEIGGERFSNTWGVEIGGSPSSQVNDADLAAIGGGTPITATNTASGAPVNVLQAIASFHRHFLDPIGAVKRIYVTDGKKNTMADPDRYLALDVDLIGLARAVSLGNDLAPGNVTLQVNKVPVGFSARPGRLFLRGYLGDTDVGLGGPKMLTFSDATVRANMASNLNTFIANSNIDDYFSGGTSSNVKLMVPKFRYTRPPAPPVADEGTLIGGTIISGLAVAGVAGRQVKRGRRQSR